jgi:signal transduction histidine kinase
MIIERMKSVKVNSMKDKAEELYKKRSSEKAFPRTESGIMKLLHELEVHRIELELQNEELQLARIKAEESEAHLRQLNATKDKLFSIISHDLRSPFTSIIGYSNMLAERVSSKDYDGIVEYARIIGDSSWRVMDLLTNLLEWSNAQTGKMDYYPEYVDLVSLITEANALSSGGAQQKSITISTHLPDSITAFVDRAMISTILRNLISNAIKFTHPHGKIVISAKENHNGLLVSVSDTGVGLSKKRIENIFRFEESNSTLGTQREHGTGLGLLLCKEFVLKHGGKIWAESEFENGSTFFFTIPRI